MPPAQENSSSLEVELKSKLNQSQKLKWKCKSLLFPHIFHAQAHQQLYPCPVPSPAAQSAPRCIPWGCSLCSGAPKQIAMETEPRHTKSASEPGPRGTCFVQPCCLHPQSLGLTAPGTAGTGQGNLMPGLLGHVATFPGMLRVNSSLFL